jgi:diguanylate cyclase (GGDEF)-like protein
VADPAPPSEQPEAPDPLARERDRVMYALSFLAVVFLLPFAVNDFLKGRNALAATIVSVVLAFAADGLAIRLRKSPPIPYAVLLVPITAAITLSLATQGVIGAFWCYPTVLFFHFVLSRRIANLCSLALLLVATAMVFRFLGLHVTIRFSVSLILTIVIVNTIQNIIRDLQARLVDQAITDPLTGVYNRRHMESRLAEALESSRRRSAPASLLLIDIDHFKRINDEHGHEAGDAVLKGLVSVVRAHARKVDLLFRMGGEEFVVLLPDTPESSAAAMAEKLRQSIAETALLDGRPVTVSIGVAGMQAGDTVESWVRESDSAMYAAKEAGRNRVARRAGG